MITRFTLLVVALLALAGCSVIPGSAGQSLELSPAPPPPVATPIALRIPSIKLNTEQAWEPLGIQGPADEQPGAVAVPDVKHPERIGWYCPADPPGCGAPYPGETGPAVVLGHINGNGRDGVFAHLSQVKVGAVVEIDRGDGYTAIFRVTTSKVVPKVKFPTTEVYGDTPTSQLRLVSCGGDFNKAARSYTGQVLVYAELTQLRPTELHPKEGP